MSTKLPKSVKICLWSYDVSKIRISNPNDHFRIILNILNYGTEDAIDWMQDNFKEKEIKETIKKSYASEWFKKRLEFWSNFYKVSPKWETRTKYILSQEKKTSVKVKSV